MTQKKYRYALIGCGFFAQNHLHAWSQNPDVELVATCDVDFEKGDELGWFQHGSTIIVFAPKEFVIPDEIKEGKVLKMGEALMHLPSQ